MKPHFRILALTGLATGLSLSGTPLHAQAISSQNSKTTAPSTTSASIPFEHRTERCRTDVTPFSQSNAEEDLKTTQKIRLAIRNKGNFSMNAENIKIITTSDHMVYLCGMVDTRKERIRIVELAEPIAGRHMLKNQLLLPNETQSTQNN